MNYAIIKVEWEEVKDTKRESILQIGDRLETALKGLGTFNYLVNHHASLERPHKATRIIITPLEVSCKFEDSQSSTGRANK